MNKAAAVIWHDDFNAKSYKIVLPGYGLKCLKETPTSEFEEKEIVIYGPTENVDRFLADLEDYCFDILDTKAADLEADEDYKAWLDEQVANFELCESMCSEMDAYTGMSTHEFNRLSERGKQMSAKLDKILGC